MNHKIFLFVFGIFLINFISAISYFEINNNTEFNNLSSENLTNLLRQEFELPVIIPFEKCSSLKYRIGVKLIRDFSFQFVFKNIDMDNFYFVLKENNCIIDIEVRKGVLNKYDVSFVLDYKKYEKEIDYKPEINYRTFRGMLLKRSLA